MKVIELYKKDLDKKKDYWFFERIMMLDDKLKKRIETIRNSKQQSI